MAWVVGVRRDTLSTMTQFMTMSVATTMTKIRNLRSPECVTSPLPLPATEGAARSLTSQTQLLLARVGYALQLRPLRDDRRIPQPFSRPTTCGSHKGNPQLPGHPDVDLPLPQLHRGESTPPRAAPRDLLGRSPARPVTLALLLLCSFSRWPSSPRCCLPWNSPWPQPMNIWSRGSES